MSTTMEHIKDKERKQVHTFRQDLTDPKSGSFNTAEAINPPPDHSGSTTWLSWHGLDTY